MITFAEVLLEARKYITDKNELNMMKTSYQIAEKAHQGQMRESGLPYITHPLEVANILVKMRQDAETICAGLLHDVVEDTEITKRDLELKLLEPITTGKEVIMCSNIANLVDGVTKVKHENYDIKILKETCKDERIMTIKLADRLHNMRTLSGKKNPVRRKEIALKTFNIFVPWAKHLGVYKIKYELEDLCFKEIAPDIYARLKDLQTQIRRFVNYELELAKKDLETMFPEKQFYIHTKIKDVYGIYKTGYPPLETGQKKTITEEMLNDLDVLNNIWQNYKSISELVQLKIIVPSKEDCYEIANKVLEKYAGDIQLNTIRDYIAAPKKNMYQSFDLVRNFMMIPIQYQIRTEEMDLVNCYGNNCLSDTNENHSGINFLNRLQQSLIQCNNDQEILDSFIELSTKKICVFDYHGNEYQMDNGNTIVDLFYKMNGGNPNEITGALVNGISVRKDYILEDHDCVMITSKSISPKQKMGPSLQLSLAKK